MTDLPVKDGYRKEERRQTRTKTKNQTALGGRGKRPHGERVCVLKGRPANGRTCQLGGQATLRGFHLEWEGRDSQGAWEGGKGCANGLVRTPKNPPGSPSVGCRFLIFRNPRSCQGKRRADGKSGGGPTIPYQTCKLSIADWVPGVPGENGLLPRRKRSRTGRKPTSPLPTQNAFVAPSGRDRKGSDLGS